MRGGKVEAGWVRVGGGEGEGDRREEERGNGEISNQIQNYDCDGSGKHEKSNRFSEKKQDFFIRESERLGDKFYCRVKPR